MSRFKPASRGDLCFLRTEFSWTTASGERRTDVEWLPGIVTSVNLGGYVKAFRDSLGTTHKSRGAFLLMAVASKNDFTVPVEELVQKLGQRVENLDDARATLSPFRVGGAR